MNRNAKIEIVTDLIWIIFGIIGVANYYPKQDCHITNVILSVVYFASLN